MDNTRYLGYERFQEKGETYFNYLINNYDTLINEEKNTHSFYNS